MNTADKTILLAKLSKTMKAAKVCDEISKIFAIGIYSHSFNEFTGKADNGCLVRIKDKIRPGNAAGLLLQLMGYNPTGSMHYTEDCIYSYFQFQYKAEQIIEKKTITENEKQLINHLHNFTRYLAGSYSATQAAPTLKAIVSNLKTIGCIYKKYVL